MTQHLQFSLDNKDHWAPSGERWKNLSTNAEVTLSKHDLGRTPELVYLTDVSSDVMTYLQVGQRHLGHAELAAGLSVFTFPA